MAQSFFRCECNMIIQEQQLNTHGATQAHQTQIRVHRIHQNNALRYGFDISAYEKCEGHVWHPCRLCGVYCPSDKLQQHQISCEKYFYDLFDPEFHLINFVYNNFGHILEIHVTDLRLRKTLEMHRRLRSTTYIECDICMEDQNTKDFEACPMCKKGICYACFNSLSRDRVCACPFCRTPYIQE